MGVLTKRQLPHRSEPDFRYRPEPACPPQHGNCVLRFRATEFSGSGFRVSILIFLVSIFDFWVSGFGFISRVGRDRGGVCLEGSFFGFWFLVFRATVVDWHAVRALHRDYEDLGQLGQDEPASG